MDHSIKQNPTEPQVKVQSISLEQVAGSESSLDVELEAPSKWKKTTCCGRPFFVDPQNGTLRETDGDSSSTAHQHEDGSGNLVLVHEGEERAATSLRRVHRENS